MRKRDDARARIGYSSTSVSGARRGERRRVFVASQHAHHLPHLLPVALREHPEPHRELLVEDGVRAGVEWEEVLRIDGMVKLLLEQFDVPYIPVASLSMQERCRLVERTLQLAGLTRTTSTGRTTAAPREDAPAPDRLGEAAR